MRIAFFSPLNPVRSGISDYSEELLPFLARLCEIDLVTDDYQPVSKEVAGAFRVLSSQEFLAAKDSYDTVIYQVGNNHNCHSYMLSCLAAVPGIVVLHDYSLTYLILPATLGSGDRQQLKEIIAPTSGKRTGLILRRLLLGIADPYEVSLARPVIETSRAVIVHNRQSYERMRLEYPAHRVQLIPHATPRRDLPADMSALRARYGFSADDLILASISTIAFNKRIHLVLNTLRQLLINHPHLKFVMVGAGEVGGEAGALIRRYGLEGCVRQTGWMQIDDYVNFIDVADVVVDLRYPTAGETSGSTLRAMQAGKPLVVSEQGSFLELPSECCIRVPVGEGEEGALLSALELLLDNPEKRRELGSAGREFAHTHLRLEQAAESYFNLACEVVARKLKPTRVWQFRAAPNSELGGKLTSSIYKAGRVVYYYRRYGWQGTLRRLRGSSVSPKLPERA